MVLNQADIYVEFRIFGGIYKKGKNLK